MTTSTAPASWGTLNAFQKVMLQWSELHPYNAFHACKIAGPLRSDRLRAAYANALERLGIGVVELSPDGRRFRHETDLDPAVELVDGGDEASAVFQGVAAGSLNRPFDRPRMKPFRLFAVRGDEQAHYLVLSYDHWVADNASVRLLLREMFGQYLESGLRESPFPLKRPDLRPDTYRAVFRQSIGGTRLLPRVYRTLREWNRNRSAWRMACWSNTDWTMDYRVFPTASDTVARLLDFARRQEATVHDVLLAAFARALAEVMPSRGKRAGLALGSIVDTRGAADVDLENAFGTFLGYYLVRVRPDGKAGLGEEARRIAACTGPIKTQRRYLDSLVNMRLISALWPRLSPTTRQHFMRKALPLSGGLSNVVMRDAWMTANRPAILEYFRGVSTGPSLPIVLTPTTFDDQLNVGVSYRTASFTRAKIDSFSDALREQLEHLETEPAKRTPQQKARSRLATDAGRSTKTR